MTKLIALLIRLNLIAPCPRCGALNRLRKVNADPSPAMNLEKNWPPTPNPLRITVNLRVIQCRRQSCGHRHTEVVAPTVAEQKAMMDAGESYGHGSPIGQGMMTPA
jgi:hypothetical protein